LSIHCVDVENLKVTPELLRDDAQL
jgi:hypothetical protein